MKTLVVLYKDVPAAENALNELHRSGFQPENYSLVTTDTAPVPVAEHDVTSAEGRDFGAIVGGLTGLLVGLGAIAIPGIGPIIAAGPLAAFLGGATGAAIGAGAGAVTGGLSAGLIQLGTPEADAELYVDAVRRGNALVTVNVNDADVRRAADILARYNPVDIRYKNGDVPSGYTAGDVPTKPSIDKDIEATRQLVRDYDYKTR